MSMVGGLVQYEGEVSEDRSTLINDPDRILEQTINEYNLWYEGDGDGLLNFYTKQNMFDYNYEPFYSRNKRNYFWTISSTEGDIKRTHSGQPRNIVDTLVNIMPFPQIHIGKVGDMNNPLEVRLSDIIKYSGLKNIYKQEQMPLTMVEGWGCYKINWDLDISDYPILVYYRATNVDFVYKMNKIIGIVFRDYYVTEKDKRYMLEETRRIANDPKTGQRMLIIEKELFKANKHNQYVEKVDFSEVKQLSDVIDYIEISNCDILLAEPAIFFKDTSPLGGYGRSIFAGKIDLFDDLDQCLSQESNSIRKSTPIEYIDTEYLERDQNGLPKQPRAYDRKYTMYRGARDTDGNNKSMPVQTTQPNINFEQYSTAAISILLQILNGIISPATFGIDIAKKDNAEAQREKEKVTIFTRNGITDVETEILDNLCSQLLCAYEFMHTGEIKQHHYDISVQFSEFADDSYENKLQVLGQAYDSEIISDRMFMKKLYGDTLSKEEFEEELKWLKEHHTLPRDQGMKGILGGGKNIEGMFDDDSEEEI
ncbi:hypothetical protein [Mammaliicoccus vitulinus]|uniref:hypothetical protein n=1 Tax=Mammaliicoccus vitulinus TaxID=71237 RepID=UPI00248C6F64|nr:hypothetical protein [Mammaliicoccus vitulinus]